MSRPAELIIYEELGLCSAGNGAHLIASGGPRRCGAGQSKRRIDRKGHPIGATGCAQIVELADQLRGRCGPRQVSGARIALAENSGGSIGPDPAAIAVTVLQTE